MRTRWLTLVFVSLAAVAGAQTPSAPVAVLGVAEEIAPFEQRLTDVRRDVVDGVPVVRGTFAGRPVIVIHSGIGKVNAALAATVAVTRFAPAAMFFSGTAGALDAELRPGDVVIATGTGQHDVGRVTADGMVRRATKNTVDGDVNPMFFPSDEALLAAARRAAASMSFPSILTPAGQRVPAIREGAIVSGDVFVADATRAGELRQLGAIAVEMEGGAMGQVCYVTKTSCLVVRSITDAANGLADESYRAFLSSASANAAALVAATIQALAR